VGTLVGTTSTTLSQFDSANGKIVAVGELNIGSCVAPIILRYNDDGTLDTSLGGSGMIFPAIGNCNHNYAGSLTDIKIDGSNRIVVAGASTAGHVVIARFSWSGNPDNSFANQGVFDFSQAAAQLGVDSSDLYVRSLRLADGKIIVAGANAFGAMIGRVLGNGTLDASFGNGGVIISPPYAIFEGVPNIDEWTWARPLGDNSLLVAGDTTYFLVPGVCQIDYGESAIMVGHYLSNGTLDTSYGGNGTGRAIYRFNTNVIDVAGALDSQGRLVIGASGTNGDYCDRYTVSDFVALRLTSNGLLDPSFDGNGFAEFAFTTNPNHLDRVTGVTVDAADRPVLLGSPDGSGFGLGCLTTGGVLDPTFGQ